MRNSLMGPPGGIDLMTYCTTSGCSTTGLCPTSSGVVLSPFGLVPMAQWLSHWPVGWQVLSSHLGTGSIPERFLKAQWVGVRRQHPLLSH